jgi:PAS domain S-box-containing protein
MRLKTKLVLAFSLMVVALVTAMSYLYVSQLVRQRFSEAHDDANLYAREVLDLAQDALQIDFNNTRIDPNNPQEVHDAIADSLQSDPGLNSLLQSIVGYWPLAYDVSIVDVNGVALLDSNADLQGKRVEARPEFAQVVSGSRWHEIQIVYGAPKVYDVHLPLQRNGAPFGDIRIGLSTVFLKNELRPQLDRALGLSIVAILVSLLLSVGLSNIALRPLEAIAQRLDRMSAGEMEAASAEAPRRDEYGVVSTKIDRLGRQMRDVKEVFSALKENLDQIMGNLEDGLMLFTRDARVVLVSASAERFVGHPRGDMLGRSVEEIFALESRLGEVVLAAFARRQPLEQRELENDDGRRVQVSLDFIEEGGAMMGALLTMRDAESVRKIEDEIELSRRLAAIGRLTSGVAHEVKNPINAIVVHLEVLREKLQQLDPDSRRHMDIIGNEIQRLDRVVQTLVDFTRPMELRLAETDLRRMLEDVVALAAPEAERHGVSIERQLPEDPLPVMVDADLVKQAVLNVVINGVQAMDTGGHLHITAARHDGMAEVGVRDTGPGIPPELRDKIFNLYFTTKAKGSGIGLAMTYRVMQLHNGSVEFESSDGKGTTFRLRFPLVARHEHAEEIAAGAPPVES